MEIQTWGGDYEEGLLNWGCGEGLRVRCIACRTSMRVWCAYFDAEGEAVEGGTCCSARPQSLVRRGKILVLVC